MRPKTALAAPAALAMVMGLQGCAVLHHVQIGDVEPVPHAQPISIKVSETTIDFGEVAAIAKGIGRLGKSRAMNSIGRGFEAYTFFFQMGPHTGTPVYNETYARNIPELLQAACPTGHLANITSIRETRSYPVVKGEIVRIDAYCVADSEEPHGRQKT